jgi:hypothetical protein
MGRAADAGRVRGPSSGRNSELAWVKVKRRFSRSSPRSALKFTPVRLSATSTRPRPRVWARSPKIGPAEAEVRTGTPPSKLKVVPPLVALTGTLETLLPIELVRNEITVLLLATAAGTKWLPWMRTDSGLLGSPVPPRKSGSSPSPKMKSWLNSSRRLWAGRGGRDEEENRDEHESAAHASSGDDDGVQSRASGASPQLQGGRARAGALASP